MLDTVNSMYFQAKLNLDVNIIKTMVVVLGIYYSNFKIINEDIELKLKGLFKWGFVIMISIIYALLRDVINNVIRILSLILIIGIIFYKSNVVKSILVTAVSLTINYAIFIISLFLDFVICVTMNLQSDYINLCIIISFQIILIYNFWRMKRFKYGISFFRKENESDLLDTLLLNISVIILFIIVIFRNANITLGMDIVPIIIISIIMMFFTIQKSLQLYYKQKLLIQELEKTKEELAARTKDNENLEKENIEISKKAHTLDHKQKSLAKKIDEMLLKAEISTEEAAEVRDRLNKIGKELYKEKTVTELAKTEITEIDDMLKFMQSECTKNKIDFELQLKGKIHYMTNNLITKEDLETLLADHIKNAIIAINHTDNVNRSILVKLGKIDENYGLYIYDSGVEFEKETLENLGKKPSTTHKDEGGTGMGFMNTFDTLRKCNASLIIEEFGKPNKDNYTKAIMIKFNNKNEFKVKSYSTL